MSKKKRKRKGELKLWALDKLSYEQPIAWALMQKQLQKKEKKKRKRKRGQKLRRQRDVGVGVHRN